MISFLTLLVTNLVPILTAAASLTAAIAACIGAWRGQRNSVAIGQVQGAAHAAAARADAAVTKAAETHEIVNSRVDELIRAIRSEADLAIAAAQRHAEDTIRSYNLAEPKSSPAGAPAAILPRSGPGPGSRP